MLNKSPQKIVTILLITTTLLLTTIALAQAAGTSTYTYDDLYRLTRVEHTNGSVTTYSYDNLGNRTTVTVAPGSTGGTCAPPASGDWIITTDCQITGTASPPANVLIQNGAILTLEPNSTLKVNLSTHHINVQNGSGLLIKTGAKISP